MSDPLLVQSFSLSNASNSQFPSGFTVGGIAWDPLHERLLIGESAGNGYLIYQTERNGVQINSPRTSSGSDSNSAATLAISPNGQTAFVASSPASSSYLFQFYIDTAVDDHYTDKEYYPSATIQSLATDAYAPTLAYMAYKTSGGVLTIGEIDATSVNLALTANSWALPTGTFTTTAEIGGFFIEPATGDFIIAKNSVYASGGSNYINIYRMTRNLSTSLLFSLNISQLGSTASGNNGNWQMAYDAKTNRLFLADSATNKVYEIVPPVMITPRQ